ncbi:E3 ubiquitin-protein ligase Nedd-4 isoform X2 [Thrips palmi]|uniref:E3 ubiquitin-protein ligase n=1 Tax=Thrips palmi TaxID=161013 RepID=A0A6P8ZWJ8_THRPL|nr:E3 ubiquitin-protein ligase Nedd-4 isoform X2 [Thrips palmi]
MADGSIRRLRLKVVAGHTLAKKDIFGASDPYVKIELLNTNSGNGDPSIDSVLTKTKKKTLNPVWNQELVFRVKPAEHKLLLQVFDENRLTRDDFLGLVELNLQNIPYEVEGRSIPSKHYLLLPRNNSTRSRVRGHLELYHAWMREPGLATSPEEGTGRLRRLSERSSTDNENTWEMVEADQSYVETAAQVRPLDETEPNSELSETVGPLPEQSDGEWEEVEPEHLNISLTPVQPNSDSLPLPLGWEERQDGNGRTYYVNHVARTTQWERPSVSETTAGADQVDIAALEFQRRFHISADEVDHNQRNSVTLSQGSDCVDSPSSSRRESSSVPASSTESGDSGNSTSNSATNSNLNSNDDASDASTQTQLHADHCAAGLPPGWSMQIAPNGRMFFIDHNERATSWVDPRTGRASPMPCTPCAPITSRQHPGDELGPLPEGWEERIHSDGRIFFIDHNTRQTQWDDPRLSNPQIAGPAVPYSRDYKKKYDFLKSQLRKPNNVPNKFEIKVNRSNILEDSYRIISTVNRTDLLKTKLWVEFEGEVGLDYGGLAREWFFLLSKEMFNPYYGLFEYSAMDNYTLQINPLSGLCNEEHLSYFKFIGRIAGMAVYHGKLLDAFFIRPFYKMMLEKTIDLKDMESVDSEYYNSLLWIKENDPTELELTFCVDEDSLGHTSQRELKPNGANEPVTNENKDEYISLVIKWRFVSRVQEQMNAFLNGFSCLVPLNLIKIFDENELELLMCGIQNIDVKDWKQNTLYKGDYHPNHITVQWFWRVVLSFNNEMRSRLLQFVTGTSRVPMNGFKELYGSNGPQLFTIEKWGKPSNYPRAHTCFNRLDLPPYDDYQQLRDKLIKAIEGSQGFAGVD